MPFQVISLWLLSKCFLWISNWETICTLVEVRKQKFFLFDEHKWNFFCLLSVFFSSYVWFAYRTVASIGTNVFSAFVSNFIVKHLDTENYSFFFSMSFSTHANTVGTLAGFLLDVINVQHIHLLNLKVKSINQSETPKCGKATKSIKSKSCHIPSCCLFPFFFFFLVLFFLLEKIQQN